MSTTSLHQPFLLHHHHHYHHHHSFSSTTDSFLFLGPTTTATATHKPFLSISSSSLTTASSLLTPTTAPTAPSSSFDALATHLAAADFRSADEETRRLLIDLAGDDARRRGYVFFSEAQFVSAADLRAIDRLWRRHSGDRFGYSVQRRLWDKSRRDFTSFFIRVGWMKKLDTEVEQHNYRAFPEEFMWELEGAPEGHLPLTNALRGTQLLACILTHPAFEEEEEEEEEEESGGGDSMSSEEKKESTNTKTTSTSSGTSKKSLLNPDYSF